MAMTIDENDVHEIIGYLRSLDSRLMSLHKTSDEIAKLINISSGAVKIKKAEFKRMFDELKKDMAEMKEEIRNIQKEIVQIITVLKVSIKSDEFSRFKMRIDLWAPETFVTRKEVLEEIERK
jgi:seryl-tRNA synthetase